MTFAKFASEVGGERSSGRASILACISHFGFLPTESACHVSSNKGGGRVQRRGMQEKRDLERCRLSDYVSEQHREQKQQQQRRRTFISPLRNAWSVFLLVEIFPLNLKPKKGQIESEGKQAGRG